MEKQLDNNESTSEIKRSSEQLKNTNSNHNNWQLLSHSQKWRPPTDVFETSGHIIIRVEIAGMQENDIDITFNNSVLNVSGNRLDTIENIKAFHQMEVSFGDFLSSIEISTPILLAKAEASYQNGILIIKLPKASPKSIIINR